MNKYDIKKALKFCADSNDCDDCPYDVVRSCSDRLKLDARELIAEQEKEIERLKDEDTRLTEKLKQVLLAVDTVKEMTAMCKIDEQNAEIERLEEENEELKAKLNARLTCDFVKTAQKHAVQDFAEKVKAKSYVNDYCREVVEIEKIDELLKEYAG